MTVYADTSFLFSLYFPDSNATAAAAKMRRTAASVLTTDFGEFEFINAVSWRVFRKDLRPADVQAVLDLLSKDVASGVIYIAPISSGAFTRAKQIARAHTPLLGSRALDVLHVAAALVLHADTLYTFDRNQAKLAAAVGIAAPQL